MSKLEHLLTRRDFVKGLSTAAVGLTIGWPVRGEGPPEVKRPKSRVVLIRDERAVNAKGEVQADVMAEMLDQAVPALLGEEDPAPCWKRLVKPEDVVGIKSNEWGNLATPPELEAAIASRVAAAGVARERIAVDDRGVRGNPVFAEASALINVRPMRTHAWSGVGSLIKNYITFADDWPSYHPNTCADLGALWHLPAVRDKTRLNILVMLTPLFHGQGWHHFNAEYTWPYRGLLVGTDPVATDTIGLSILEAKREQFFGEKRPIRPPAHHIRFADTRHGLGTSDPDRIELIRLGWAENALI
jgi:hypothetical protein